MTILEAEDVRTVSAIGTHAVVPIYLTPIKLKVEPEIKLEP